MFIMTRDIGLLIFRLGVGGLMASHGWPKLMSFTERMDTFPDPIGLGSPTSLALATFAEFFCSIAVILGLWTRWAALPILTTMGVAAFIFHANDPWSAKELPVLFFISFLSLFFLGGGRFSLDRMFFKSIR